MVCKHQSRNFPRNIYAVDQKKQQKTRAKYDNSPNMPKTNCSPKLH